MFIIAKMQIKEILLIQYISDILITKPFGCEIFDIHQY